MITSNELILGILPAIIGIVAAGLAIAFIVRMGANFFRVVSGWSVVALIASLVVIWTITILDSLSRPMGRNVSELVSIGFVVASSWLGVGVIGMTTLHGKYSEVKVFGAWLLRNPVNVVTIYAVGGLAVFAVAAAGLAGPLGQGEDIVLLGVVLSFIIAAVAAEAALPILSEIRGHPSYTKEGRKQVVMFAALWMLIPCAQFAFNLVHPVSDYLGKYNPSSWILAISFVLMMRIIFTTRIMAIIVDPEVETSKRGGFRSYDIPRGVYLVYDERSDSAFHLFSELVLIPLRPDAHVPEESESASATLSFLIPRGFVITRSSPESVRERYRLQVTPIVWLTESPGERRIAPTSITMVTDTMVRFMDANPNSIVLLEGLEYLVTFNDFKKVMRSLDALNESAWITKARLIVAVNPLAFDEKERALLERDRTVLRGPAEIEELKRESRVMAESKI